MWSYRKMVQQQFFCSAVCSSELLVRNSDLQTGCELRLKLLHCSCLCTLRLHVVITGAAQSWAWNTRSVSLMRHIKIDVIWFWENWGSETKLSKRGKKQQFDGFCFFHSPSVCQRKLGADISSIFGSFSFEASTHLPLSHKSVSVCWWRFCGPGSFLCCSSYLCFLFRTETLLRVKPQTSDQWFSPHHQTGETGSRVWADSFSISRFTNESLQLEFYSLFLSQEETTECIFYSHFGGKMRPKKVMRLSLFCSFCFSDAWRFIDAVVCVE